VYVRTRGACVQRAVTVLSTSDPWRAGPPFLTWLRPCISGSLVSIFLFTTREQGAMEGAICAGGERCQTAEETSTTSRRRCEGQLFRSWALCVAQRSFFAAGLASHRRVSGRRPRGVSVLAQAGSWAFSSRDREHLCRQSKHGGHHVDGDRGHGDLERDCEEG
jgi:hypothetical protein